MPEPHEDRTVLNLRTGSLFSHSERSRDTNASTFVNTIRRNFIRVVLPNHLDVLNYAGITGFRRGVNSLCLSRSSSSVSLNNQSLVSEIDLVWRDSSHGLQVCAGKLLRDF